MFKPSLQAGASCVDVTPSGSVFLFGYPHVKRYSTGVHDPLLCSALYLHDGQRKALFISCDLIFVSKSFVAQARRQIERQTGVPCENVLIAATHTHSGPMTADYICCAADTVVPQVDPAYLAEVEEAMVLAAKQAVTAVQPAETALVLADGSGVGTNRRDPTGPSDPQVPVLLIRHVGGQPLAAMLICSMHPTVLHEDSTLISGDFPAAARRYIQEHLLHAACPVVYFTGPSGNQSPRHVTRGNTFEEAERLGTILGRAVEKAASEAQYAESLKVLCDQTFVELPRRPMPTVNCAATHLENAVQRLGRLRNEEANRQEIRTAECDWFGAEETLTLAQAAQDGRLAAAYQSVMPAEIQLIKIGPWSFIGWPGELFVEYALELKRQTPDTFIIALANGELQGYIVTPEAEAEGGYEASNAIFASESGTLLVRQTLALLAKQQSGA